MHQRENSTQLDGKYKLVVVVRIPDRQEVIHRAQVLYLEFPTCQKIKSHLEIG